LKGCALAPEVNKRDKVFYEEIGSIVHILKNERQIICGAIIRTESQRRFLAKSKRELQRLDGRIETVQAKLNKLIEKHRDT